MKALLHFEYSRFYSKIWFYVLLLLILGFGFVVGTGLSLSLSQNIYKNSPYTITLMSGFLSLFVIFFSTMLITQIAFKETDSRFHLIFYALPIPEKIFLLSRFWVIFSLSFLGFFLLILGFSIGQQFATNRSQYTHFQWLWYAQPLLVLGLVNTLFCSAVLSAVAWLSRNKMMVYVSGLLLYVLYMVALIFSGSPLMAKGMPQSELNTLLSAILDPFGISGFFYETSHWTVEQRNSEMIFPEGVFLYNRLGFTFLSLILGWVVLKKFSFEKQQNSLKSKIVDKQEIKTKRYHPYGILSEYKLFRYFLLRFRLDETSIQTKESQRDGSLIEKKYTTRQAKSQRDDTFFGRIINSIPFRHLIALFSITKIDLKYVFKSIPFVLICLGFLFCVGMEMFGDIEKGIRLPQKFARSGLMASTIIDEFNIFCLFGIVFYANDLFWRSRASNFHLIESSTPTQKNLIIASKWLSLGLLILFFSCLMILLGIAFQLLYHFPHIDWLAYTGVFVFVSFRVFVAAGFMLFIEQFLPNKILALLVSSIFIGVFATAFGNRFLDYPALEFLMPFAGKYSDMNGYGSYLGYFILRYTFGLSLVIFLLAKPYRFLKPIRFVLVIIPLFLGFQLSKNYQKEDKESEILKAVNYEKQYRKFQNLAKPTVSNLKTKIDLFPENQTYQIEGEYILQNKTSQKIDSVLINFVDDFEIQNSDFEGNKIENQYAVIHLKKPILPNDSAKMKFKISYHWDTVNGHQSLNSIVENGSFMRISRYYPQIGYLSDKEILDEDERKKHRLGKPTELKKLEAARNSIDDFIDLDMTVSCPKNQTVIGVGELKNQWIEGERAFFRYKTESSIPFRFALSAAQYTIKKEVFRGKSIEIYYHPSHHQNVNHLLQNIKVTMEYCEQNFGKYPFKTIRFAEISAFTKGFAATAYPASIFMAENMVFDANIHADKKQDVINELAGHELSHLWWGNNQISPDNREGAAMLTETLAMYTELMVSKRLHGQKRVLENVAMFERMYMEERGFVNEPPLYRLLSENVHLSYYKGFVAMYQLSELIGEQKVNEALRNFLKNHAYPNQKPITNDLLSAFYAVSDVSIHPKIDDLFKRITIYDFSVKSINTKAIGKQFEVKIDLKTDKFYEDGKGKKTKASFDGNVEIQFIFADGKTEIRQYDSKPYIFTKKPVKIVIDPRHLFLNVGEREEIEVR